MLARRHVPMRAFSGGRPVMETDVVIVGGGPAGLSAAIRLRQLDPEARVMLIEKGSSLGAHTLSGAVINTAAMDELLGGGDGGWRTAEDAPMKTRARKDQMRYLTEKGSWPLPMPPQMRNASKPGNYVVSLQKVVQWLGKRAEEAGAEIFCGFGGRELHEESGRICGVTLNDVGVRKDGSTGSNFEQGMTIKAKLTMLAEGCHGSLSKQAIAKYDLRKGRQYQTYGLGIKEVWRVQSENFEEGLVFHSLGYPLINDSQAYGGGFMYHFEDQLVSLGLVVGLDYRNPFLNPYLEFQRFKKHPLIGRMLKGGQCISYGARALNEGGFQSIPKLHFAGGLLLGCSAGFLNVPEIKGTHYAMKSGMLAAETAVEYLRKEADDTLLADYDKRVSESWIAKELWEVRNVRPSFKFGFWPGVMLSGMSTILFRGKEPWTLDHHTADHLSLKPASKCKEIRYAKSDGETTFDLLESVSRTGTNHNEDQPSHLQLTSGTSPQLNVNYPKFGGPEARFCPAGVYEYVKEDGDQEVKFVINAQNCIHCKTCDIKDPSQNINWVVPEGGGGPNYQLT